MTYFSLSLSEARRFVMVLATFDELEPMSPVTAASDYDLDTDEWSFFKLDIRATSVCVGDKELWYIGDRGEVWLSRSGKLSKGQLPDSGVTGKRHLGQPNHIRLVAGHPYVCGFAGQFYRWVKGDSWEHMDDGLAEKTGEVDSIDLIALDGTGPNDLYTVGNKGLIAHWNGKAWKRVEVLTDASLYSVRCFARDDVWAVGDQGVVVHFDGKKWSLEQLPGAEEHSLSDVERFQDKLYVATGNNLLVREGKAWKQVRHGLPKKKTGFLKLAVGFDRLWALGEKRLNSFDGKKWQAYPDPDNG
jgi:hypothetical protein